MQPKGVGVKQANSDEEYQRNRGENWYSTTEDKKLSGLAFSILAALDGSSVAIPAFAVTPSPHISLNFFTAVANLHVSPFTSEEPLS
jgi:hypothetical protein